jgi:hypothetical protein
VASAIAADLAATDPVHAAYYKASAASFTASLAAWNTAIAKFRATYPGTPVATTEPVADYMLEAVGADNLTPWTFQADIMNGTDPSPGRWFVTHRNGVRRAPGLFAGKPTGGLDEASRQGRPDHWRVRRHGPCVGAPVREGGGNRRHRRPQ